MSLLQTIKTQQLQARKARDTIATALLTTLLGEASSVGKTAGNRESTDEEVIKVIKKFVTNTTEFIKLLVNVHFVDLKSKHYTDRARELSLLKGLLPKQLDEVELSAVISQIISDVQATSLKDMGKIMKALKEQYAGTYDGAQANVIVKRAFTS